MEKLFFLCLCPLIVALAGSGCMHTGSLRGKIRESQSAAREFAPLAQTKGTYHGTKNLGNIEYHHYVFPEALVDHSQRHLVMLIPLDRYRRSLNANPRAILRESPPVADSGRKAILYLNPKGFREPHPGQDQDLRWPKGTGPNTEKDVGVVVLWIPYSGYERDIVVAQAAPGIRKSNESFNSYHLNSELKYVARSRLEGGVKSLGYLGTIPMDVVTSPYQGLIIAAFAFGR